MVQVDLELKQVLDLGDNMTTDKFKALLEEFTKEDFVKHHLEETNSMNDEDDDNEFE